MTLHIRDGQSNFGYDLIIMRNVTGGVLLRGSPVVLDTTTLDGVRVVLPTTALLSSFVGVAYRDLQDGEYGLFQKNGYCDYARVIGDGGSVTAIGDWLKLVNGQAYFTRGGAADGRPAFATAKEVIGIGAAVAARRVWLGPAC